jgi:hypothetical protein
MMSIDDDPEPTVEDTLRLLCELRAPGRFIVLDTLNHRAVIPGGAMPEWTRVAEVFDAPDGGRAFVLRFWPACPPEYLAYLPMLASVIRTAEGVK